MRLSEEVILQYIEAGGRDDFYNLVRLGDEIPMTRAEMARLWVGLTYFVQSDPALRDQVIETLRQLTGQARNDARAALINALGTISPMTPPAGVPQ